MSVNKLAHKAMYESKSYGRKGRKGVSKKVAHRAARAYGKALCKDGSN